MINKKSVFTGERISVVCGFSCPAQAIFVSTGRGTRTEKGCMAVPEEEGQKNLLIAQGQRRKHAKGVRKEDLKTGSTTATQMRRRNSVVSTARTPLRRAEQGPRSFCLQEAPWQRRQLAGGSRPSPGHVVQAAPHHPSSSLAPAGAASGLPSERLEFPRGYSRISRSSRIQQQRELWERKKSRGSLAGAALGKEAGKEGSGRSNRGLLCCTRWKRIGHLLVDPLDEE
ncbi:uncharacterized protein LOC128914359 [Rissa tridactyla]|uniref:uncharacterized protein LOC128914359 n=1 Tax=Rissa tridactyla TaxID=75485 RepID=UPI0023BA43CB|nr:uncharacterized protein LOC128914359 [Rissa tridactyla]